MAPIIAHAPAKINLALEVEPLQAGEEKHRLSSIFCTTALADTLIFDFISGSEPFNAEVDIQSTDFDISFIKPRDNSLVKTVEQFKREYGFGFLPSGTLKVQLVKSIPTQAGLGGGSANAAAMLRMLCWLAQVEPTSARSLAVARAVGADVPFFIHAPKTGFCALMGGYGDELLEELPKPNLNLALVKPAAGVSTKKAYAEFDRRQLPLPAVQTPESTALHSLAATLRTLPNTTGEDQADALPVSIAALCTNNLEPVAIKLLPQIANIKREMQQQPGVLGTNLCGSGSTVFAICASANSARNCVQYFASQGLWSVATQT